MINALRLQNFKCFEDQSFDFGKITLLSGLNGMGKSSVLQALLLLRQSLQQGAMPGKGLALNGEAVSLGIGRDILYEDAQEPKISITLAYKQEERAHWQFRYEPEADLLGLEREDYQTSSLRQMSLFPEAHGFYRPKINADTSSLRQMSLFTDEFHYLQAERIGPRPSFAVSDYNVNRHRQLGNGGEYTAHFLSVYGAQDIPIAGLVHPDGTSHGLIHQIEAWLSVVSPGIRIEISPYRGMDIIDLKYSFALGRKVSNSYRAINVGFGITYTLPVLTAVLSSRPGSLLLLENPEAHLHPRGQVHIGELLALAAANGVQVLVETHSDHVLNGIRLAVHAGKVAPADVSLYYFGRVDKSGQAINEVVQPKIDRNGRIDQWPAGFFDELDTSLSILLEPAGNGL